MVKSNEHQNGRNDNASLPALRPFLVPAADSATEELPWLQKPILGPPKASGYGPRQKPEWVYVGASECKQYVKIGFTTCPGSKLSAIAHAAKAIIGPDAPKDWRFLTIFPGSMETEVLVQDIFNEHRFKRGVEWFYYCAPIVSFAEAMNALYSIWERSKR